MSPTKHRRLTGTTIEVLKLFQRLLHHTMKGNNTSLRSSSTKKVRFNIPMEHKPRFYSMHKLSEQNRPLDFLGIPAWDCNMKIFEIKAVSRKIVELIDRFEEIVTGHCNIPRTLNAITHPVKSGKASQVFYNTFFRGFGFDDITISLQPMVLISMLRLRYGTLDIIVIVHHCSH